MIEFTHKDIITESLSLLDEFDKFCRANKLKYSLAFGTLIGAIRHNGFIPWDDDIDVMMPRSDYEVFMQSFFSNDAYVVNCHNYKKYTLPFGKLCKKNTLKIEPLPREYKINIGFCIDVFPFDYVSDFNHYRKKRLKQKHIIYKRNLACFYSNNKNIKHSILRIIRLPFAHKANKYACLIDKTFNNCHGTSMCQNDPFFPNKFYFFDFDVFENLEEHLFEGKKYLITSRYDDLLRLLYGDYMNFPPAEQQKTHHDYKAFYDEKLTLGYDSENCSH